jgi:hypothetical protein
MKYIAFICEIKTVIYILLYRYRWYFTGKAW